MTSSHLEDTLHFSRLDMNFPWPLFLTPLSSLLDKPEPSHLFFSGREVQIGISHPLKSQVLLCPDCVRSGTLVKPTNRIFTVMHTLL